MAAKYLKSLVTGVVLPYNEPALKCADIRLMEPAECAEYEATLPNKAKPKPKAKAKPKAVKQPKVEPEAKKPVKAKVVVEDISEVDGVLAALETD